MQKARRKQWVFRILLENNFQSTIPKKALTDTMVFSISWTGKYFSNLNGFCMHSEYQNQYLYILRNKDLSILFKGCCIVFEWNCVRNQSELGLVYITCTYLNVFFGSKSSKFFQKYHENFAQKTSNFQKRESDDTTKVLAFPCAFYKTKLLSLHFYRVHCCSEDLFKIIVQ